MRSPRPQPDPLDHNRRRRPRRQPTDRRRTIRTRLVAISGRIVNRAGRPTLRLPINWPWKKAFTTALDTLRTLRPAPA